MVSGDNRRIVKNTIFLYMRMLFVMVIALYTSRVVLESLGVVDYGVYNVVGGVSFSLMFFSISLTQSTQRFLNVELGKGDLDRANKIFNICLLSFSVIALLFLTVGCVFGRWFVTTKLVIPEGETDAAVTVLYATILALCLTLVFSVYESVLIARENMKIYAYVGVFEAVAKLGIAYVIIVVNNKLVVYAWLLLIVQLLPKIIMMAYCRSRYSEARIKFYWNTSMFKEVLTFNGWNIYGGGVWVIYEQGINILLNIFYGPVVNAANGIAVQVGSTVRSFSANFFVAVRPQIIKLYAIGNFDELRKLIIGSTKFSFFLLWIICLPLLMRLDYIMHLWLKDVPDYAVTFSSWGLVMSLVTVVQNPVWSTVAAIGRMKKFILLGTNALLLIVPVSYVFLYYGFSPVVVYPVCIFAHICYQVITLCLVKSYIGLSIRSYVRSTLMVMARVVIVSLPLAFFADHFIPESFIGLVSSAIVTVIVIIATVSVLGLTSSERALVISRLPCIHR